MIKIDRSKYTLFLIFLTIFLFHDTSSHAKASAAFDVMDVEFGGKVQLAFKADITPSPGDEIVVVYKKGKYPALKLFIAAFEVNLIKGGLFHKEVFNSQVKQDFVFIDSGGGPGKQSLFLLGTSGVYQMNKASSWHPHEIIQARGLVGLAEEGNAFYFDFVRDLDSDGQDEILVPHKEGAVIWGKKANGAYSELWDLKVHPKFYYRSSYMDLPFDRKYSFKGSYWFPQMISSDLNGDGNEDILFFWEDELTVFYGSPSGFSNDKRSGFFLNVLSDRERDERNAYAVFFVKDLDGNGLPDLIMNKFKGAFTSHVSSSEVIIRSDADSLKGKTLRWNPEDGLWQGALAKDINGDGKADLLVSSASFGVFSILKAVLKKRIDIKFSFHTYRSPQGYLEKPDYSRTVSIGFDLKNTEMMGVIPTLDGDFNGDGLVDVFYAKENDEARVVLNEKDGKFSTRDAIKQEVGISKNYFFADVNGDSKSDLAFYFKRGKLRNSVRILLSRID